MAEFRSHCPCLLCRKDRALLGHTGVDYAQPAPPKPWHITNDGYIRPIEPVHASGKVWPVWEIETPIFHDAAVAHNEAEWAEKQREEDKENFERQL